MSATNAFEDKILSLYLTNVAAANIGDAGGLQPSATAGSVYISLHTSDPGETGDQTTNETTYTSYARQAVARSAAGWTVTSGVCDNDAQIAFPTGTGGSGTVTHFGVGSAVSGAGNRDLNGTCTPNLVVGSGVTPSFAAGALDIALE